MTKKKEESRKEELIVFASPTWSLRKDGVEIKLNSPCGFFADEPENNETLVQVKITVEEV